MFKTQIIDKIQSDKSLALRLDEALNGVGQEIAQQTQRIGDGITRLSWYVSCLTENYQDVCSRLKDEDVRFILGIEQLIKRRDIIYDMIKIYIDNLFSRCSSKDIQKINDLLLSAGVRISSTQFTNFSYAFTITHMIQFNFNLRASYIWKANLSGVMLLGNYGLVQEASDAANRLKAYNYMYYTFLRREKLEMMYFLVEPLIRSTYYNLSPITNEEIASILKRLMRCL